MAREEAGSWGSALMELAISYLACGFVHELGHALAAIAVGSLPTLTLRNCASAAFLRKVHIQVRSDWHEKVIRHAGWLTSIVVAAGTWMAGLSWKVTCVAWLTALEALCSDLLHLPSIPSGNLGWFLCGNFGMIILNPAWTVGTKAKDILEKMVEVTMMRGAQSGGVVTYLTRGSRRDSGMHGVRGRVVNGKRTTLSKLVRAKVDATESKAKRWGTLATTGRVYAGHTRFATTSKATFDGTHPHQWSKPQCMDIYMGFADGELKKRSCVNVEVFICHNGDLDFFEVGGKTYDLGAIQSWLVRATGFPMPAAVDSCAIAGLVDLLRTQGSWFLSVRYAFLFGLSRASLDYAMPSQATFQQAAACFDTVFQPRSSTWPCNRGALQGDIVGALKTNHELLRRLGLGNGSDIAGFVEKAVAAFFDNDLLQAGRLLLGGAKGSFGLCLTSSLDSHRQIVLAARGQTISVAFYPETGLVLYGSEQAAVKAAAGVPMSKPKSSASVVVPTSAKETAASQAEALEKESTASTTASAPQAPKAGKKQAVTRVMDSVLNSGSARRLDLDDLGGELCLLDWGQGPPTVSQAAPHLIQPVMNSTMTVTLVQESKSHGKFFNRLVPIEGNPLVLPLPPTSKEPVGDDIRSIPKTLGTIQHDWVTGASPNRLTAWNLGRQLKKRVTQKADGTIAKDAVDILITGCEVSLWLGEQFAADLSLAFKKLVVRTMSSNKVLGLLGQEFAMPQVGHQFSDGLWDLTDAIVIIVSHSGGTFGPLAVSNLLQSVTSQIFVVTSEWDTQIGKQLRQLDVGKLRSRVFSTEIGLHPAEPCTVSVAATHQLLTQIFQHIANVLHEDPTTRQATGCELKNSDLEELERCNQSSIEVLEEICGTSRQGHALKDAETEKDLRKKGAHWAQHVLESPRAWIMCAFYVLGTVTARFALITGTVTYTGIFDTYPDLVYAACFLDALVYLFLPQICILLIRLVQRRPLLHRMAGRGVVIGDCPWVAQSAEAFLSKVLACSYSIASVTVFSANPADHLVHRMTHRVVRGSLLACGRPDGRLSALTTLENSVCLSVNQASSIQSLGATCESLTIGHNPYKLPLSAHAVFLKGSRPEYLCEHLLKEGAGAGELKPMSSGSLLGEYSNLSAAGNARAGAGAAPHSIEAFVEREKAMNRQREGQARLSEALRHLDAVGGTGVSIEDFEEALKIVGKELSSTNTRRIFDQFDLTSSGKIAAVQAKRIVTMDVSELFNVAQSSGVNGSAGSGLVNVKPSAESFFGQALLKEIPRGVHPFKLVDMQSLSMQLYENRIASLQRAVAFFVLFHEMGKQIADFWPRVSFGLLGYDIGRTHSIMRIATTASPVSGADVRHRMHEIAMEKSWEKLRSLLGVAVRWRRKQSKASSQHYMQDSVSSHERQALTMASDLKLGSVPPPAMVPCAPPKPRDDVDQGRGDECVGILDEANPWSSPAEFPRMIRAPVVPARVVRTEFGCEDASQSLLRDCSGAAAADTARRSQA